MFLVVYVQYGAKVLSQSKFKVFSSLKKVEYVKNYSQNNLTTLTSSMVHIKCL